jgi:hypothetical protein
MKKTTILKIFSFVFVCFSFFVFTGSGRTEFVLAKTGDALAIRVLPNEEHYNPETWYEKQGFTGTPISMEVDGYRAVRDGRTVYVNVANIDDNGTPGNHADDSLYTNIYLISYNQEAGEEIVSVFDQVLSHWKFNANLVIPGKCFNQETERKCLADSDCDDGAFCDSLKAKLARDTKRLGDIVDLREKIENYKNNTGFYPELTSGTYITGKTVSTWPSWNGEFASVLGEALPIDPINSLGDCGGDNYDKKTCWDEQNKIFADPDPDNNMFELPEGSEALMYAVDSSAQSYTACAYMESGFLVGDELGACYGGNTFNNPPKIKCGEMYGLVGREFIGYVSANDPENDNFNLSVSNQSGLVAAGFSLSFDSGKHNLSITSNSPRNGDYNVNVQAFDGSNLLSSEICKIKISTQAFIIYPVADKRQVVGEKVSVSVYANSSNDDYAGLAFNIVSSDGRSFSCSPKVQEDGRVRCSFEISSDISQNITLTVSASTNSMTAASQKFAIEFYNNPPTLSSPVCGKSVRSGSDYSCDFKFSDPDGNSLGGCYADNLPEGFSFRPFGENVCRLSGKSENIGIYSLSLTAADQYGAGSNPVNLDISIVDYCGDGKKQTPNLEGKGGKITASNPGGDGYEECDCGATFNEKSVCYNYNSENKYVPVSSDYGVPTLEQSSLSWQYGCTLNCASANEGYCGDGTVQSRYGEECDFGGDINCCKGCKWDNSGPTKEISAAADRTLSAGSSMNVTLPTSPLSRGFLSGKFDASVYTNDVSDKTGPAIVFAVDASYLAKFSIDDLIAVVKNFLTKLYNASNDNHANIYVSSFAFGDCSGGPICNIFKSNVLLGKDGLVNFKNFTAAREGYMNYLEALSSVDLITYYGDTTYNGDGSSGAIYGIKKAGEILRACDSKCGTSADPSCVPNPKCQGATEKYLIILSDGVDVAESIDEAKILKDSGVEIYTMLFTHRRDAAEQMSKWSSDYDNSSQSYVYPCNSGHYSFGNYSSSGVCNAISDNFDSVSEANKIFDQIIKNVLDNIPATIKYTVNGVKGTLSGSTNGVYFALGNNIICDKSGKTSCTTKYFELTLDELLTKTGAPSSAKIRFNNFILNRLPLCNEE